MNIQRVKFAPYNTYFSMSQKMKHCTVSFKSDKKQDQTLISKYGLDIDNIDIIANEGTEISPEVKTMLVEKILEAHELALKNYNHGNIAHAGYATNIGLENDLWHVATNFNNTRNDISAVCGERSAILGAYNDLLKSKSIYDINKSLDFKVKYIAMSSYKEIGTDKNAASSCAECLSWFNTNRYFSDDIVIASLIKLDNNKLALKLSYLKEYLPYRGEKYSAKGLQLNKLKTNISDNAQAAMQNKNISLDEIKRMLYKLQKQYNGNELTKTSGQNIVASVMANNEIFSAPKIDFSKRWFTDPILFASSKAIEKYGNDTHIDLIACFGDSENTDECGIVHNDGILNIKTLGSLLTKYASSNSLIVTTTENTIEIKTLDDYMPDKFKFCQGYKII